MWKRGESTSRRPRLWTAIGIALTAAALCAVMIVPALRVEAGPGCTPDGSTGHWEEWWRTSAAIAQDSSRCEEGEVCLELCHIDQCDRTSTPTGSFACFAN